MADDKNNNGPESKSGAVTAQRLKVGGLRGAYLDARFGNDGVSEAPVSAATEESLRKDFPNMKITAVKEPVKTETK